MGSYKYYPYTLFWGTSSRKFSILTFVSVPGETEFAWTWLMYPVRPRIKENAFSDTPVRNYLAYITGVGVIPIALTPSSNVLKKLAKEIVVLQTNLPNHSNLGTKFCTPPGKGCQGITPSSGILFVLLLVPLQAEDCITSMGDLAANSWKRR